MRWVVDASIAAKWLVPEPESQAASDLLDDDLIAPDLLYAEVANVLWKRHRRREMTAGAIQAAARWLAEVPLQVHDGVTLVAGALGLAARLDHPAYDCFYLQLAVRCDCTLITADHRLFERCRRADASDLAERVWLLGRDARRMGH